MIADKVTLELSPDMIYSQIHSTIGILFEPWQVIELRVIFANGRIDSGYFNNHQILAEAAVSYDKQENVKGIYATLNPVLPELLSRSPNKMRESVARNRGDETTRDSEIVERRLILIDIDPQRPSGTSSSQSELDAADKKAFEIVSFLKENDVDDSFLTASGNGRHILLPTQIPNNDKSTAAVRGFLAALATRFNDELAVVDTTAANAARIFRLPFTVARKGISTAERPHRRAQMLGKGVDYYGIN